MSVDTAKVEITWHCCDCDKYGFQSGDGIYEFEVAIEVSHGDQDTATTSPFVVFRSVGSVTLRGWPRESSHRKTVELSKASLIETDYITKFNNFVLDDVTSMTAKRPHVEMHNCR
jgi:hypothetical protein